MELHHKAVPLPANLNQMVRGYRYLLRLILTGDWRYLKESYGQEGEDLILERYFGKDYRGYYVDVGAHHPRRFSNTYLLFSRGWKGINIDANPDSIQGFLKERPKDTNLALGIAETKGVLAFYRFKEGASNTFDAEIAAEIRERGEQQLSVEKIATSPLSDVLDQYLPAGQQIDYLNIDVEGLDFQALRSLNLARYRPRIISIEDRGNRSVEASLEREIPTYLKRNGYALLAKTYQTYFFVDSSREII
jgi:FkbM family methyltransferase